jgi:hypothetical protein
LVGVGAEYETDKLRLLLLAAAGGIGEDNVLPLAELAGEVLNQVHIRWDKAVDRFHSFADMERNLT